MALMDIAIGLLLFVFLAILTLMINPPEAWVQKWTSRKDKKPR